MNFDITAVQDLLSRSATPRGVPAEALGHVEQAHAWKEVGDFSAAAHSLQLALEHVQRDTPETRSYAGSLAAQRADMLDQAHLTVGLLECCDDALQLGVTDLGERQVVNRIRGKCCETAGKFADALDAYSAAQDTDAAERVKMLAAAAGQAVSQRERHLTGERVELTGLKNAALNGQFGYCDILDPETGRYAVTLEGTGKVVAVKPHNLIPVAAGSPEKTAVPLIQELGSSKYVEDRPVYSTAVQGTEIVVHVELPGVHDASQVLLEFTTQRLELVVEGRYRLDLDLPRAVDPDSVAAKFDRSLGTMDIRTTCLEVQHECDKEEHS